MANNQSIKYVCINIKAGPYYAMQNHLYPPTLLSLLVKEINVTILPVNHLKVEIASWVNAWGT